MADERRAWWTKVTRDLVLFSAGLLLTINEALRSSVDRPDLLVLFAGMMGLPAMLRYDEQRRRGKDDK
jgi:hypothetical protein